MKLKEGETEKSKSYMAVVRVASPVSQEDLQLLNTDQVILLLLLFQMCNGRFAGFFKFITHSQGPYIRQMYEGCCLVMCLKN